MTDHSEIPPATTSAQTLWHITKLICFGVVVISVLSCVAIAAVRSNGLTQVTVTAIDADAEPRDHGIPLIKQKDALPDYEVVVFLNDGQRIKLGARPNTSAAAGLTWTLNDPVSIAEVAGVRLQDQDKLISDALTEVQITSASVSADNYKFDFTIERSMSVGVQSFFRTPIGKAIAGAFFIAILLIVVSVFAI